MIFLCTFFSYWTLSSQSTARLCWAPTLSTRLTIAFIRTQCGGLSPRIATINPFPSYADTTALPHRNVGSVPYRSVPSKIAVLYRLRFNCCNKGPHIRVADRSLHHSPTSSGGRQFRVAGLLSLMLLSSQGSCPHPQGPGLSFNLRAKVPSSRTEGEAEGMD